VTGRGTGCTLIAHRLAWCRICSVLLYGAVLWCAGRCSLAQETANMHASRNTHQPQHLELTRALLATLNPQHPTREVHQEHRDALLYENFNLCIFPNSILSLHTTTHLARTGCAVLCCAVLA